MPRTWPCVDSRVVWLKPVVRCGEGCPWLRPFTLNCTSVCHISQEKRARCATGCGYVQAIVLFLPPTWPYWRCSALSWPVRAERVRRNPGRHGHVAGICNHLRFRRSLISLMISKWMAKRSTGAVVIEQPGNESEQWLVRRCDRQAEAAGIKMPEVRRSTEAPDDLISQPAPSRNKFTGGRARAACVRQ